MKKIVIFASGSGSNAENIIKTFKNDGSAIVQAVFCNKPNAGVIARAERLNIPVHLFDKESFTTGQGFDDVLNIYNPDLIVLAGFLWLFPARILKKYPNRVINIHPALLPKYGGKGMYGHHVHKAVLANGVKEHGVTVHYVNEKFDDGEIILQESFNLKPGDKIEDVEDQIHEIEFRLYPAAIKKVLNGQ